MAASAERIPTEKGDASVQVGSSPTAATAKCRRFDAAFVRPSVPPPVPSRFKAGAVPWYTPPCVHPEEARIARVTEICRACRETVQTYDVPWEATDDEADDDTRPNTPAAEHMEESKANDS